MFFKEYQLAVRKMHERYTWYKTMKEAEEFVDNLSDQQVLEVYDTFVVNKTATSIKDKREALAYIKYNSLVTKPVIPSDINDPAEEF